MTPKQFIVVDQAVPADIPDKREYESEENAELDRKLADAIEAAENVDDNYLARLLALELGSHYYENR